MSDSSTSDTGNDAAPSPSFEIRMRGYDRSAVDVWLAEHVSKVTLLTETLRERDAQIARMETQLERSRRELRYWHDRQVFVDAEVERARTDAERIEREAHERSRQLEADTQERALRMIDRVCSEANGILEHARAEAQALMARYDDDVNLSHRRLAQLSEMQVDVVQAMRGAMSRFEQGVSELELVTPSARVVRWPHEVRGVHAPVEVSAPARPSGAGTATTTIDPTVLDTRKQVTIDPAIETARRMARESLIGVD